MSMDHRDRHPAQQQQHAHTDDTHNGRHNDDDTLHRIDMEPEQSCCSKIVVLSAIVLFLSFLVSSVPNLLSKQQSPLPLVVKDTVLPSSSPSPVHQHFAHVVNNQNNHQHDSHDATGGAAAGNNPWAHMTVGGQPDSKAQQDISNHPVFTQGSLSLAYPPPASASASASAFSSYQSSQDRQRQQHPPKDSQPKQGSTIWPVVQASAWFAYRASLWSIRTSYLAARSVIAKPYSVVAALFETPYMMMKDICLAFLPVYSFFTIAAVIGILVGGSAMWIAQLLISAIGADQETTSTSTALGYSQLNPAPYHAFQQPTGTFNQGQQRQQEPMSRVNPSDRPISPATIPRDSLRSRDTTTLLSRTPVATTQTALEQSVRRRREILTDDEDDDDDDDDDDNNWGRV